MYIKVKVTTGAKREVVEKISEDHYDISVKEKAKNNSANKRVLEIAKNMFACRHIKIISGHHSPSKILSIDKSA
ncbi:MAG TPA: DUF167 family protein [Candidatus Paceibacterota bacterium]